jgi:hypothetical protein
MKSGRKKMNKEEFMKLILLIEKKYLNDRPNKGDVVRDILRKLEEEWVKNDSQES